MLKLDWEIVFTIFNILVLFLFFRVFLFKPVNNILEKRAELINNSLQEAENSKLEALQIKDNYELEQKQAKTEASVILKEARERADIEYKRILAEAKQEAGRIIAETNKSIELERKKSLESAQAEIAGIAMLAAVKVLGNNVDDNRNQQLLNDLIQEVGAAK